MCLAIPYKVLEVKENSRAEIEVAGTKQEVSLRLFPKVEAGDWVLINLGSVIAKVDEDEGGKIIRLYREITKAEIQ
jgi:hydrogenase expression/formation protein HypC